MNNFNPVPPVSPYNPYDPYAQLQQVQAHTQPVPVAIPPAPTGVPLYPTPQQMLYPTGAMFTAPPAQSSAAVEADVDQSQLWDRIGALENQVTELEATNSQLFNELGSTQNQLAQAQRALGEQGQAMVQLGQAHEELVGQRGEMEQFYKEQLAAQEQLISDLQSQIAVQQFQLQNQ